MLVIPSSFIKVQATHFLKIIAVEGRISLHFCKVPRRKSSYSEKIVRKNSTTLPKSGLLGTTTLSKTFLRTIFLCCYHAIKRNARIQFVLKVNPIDVEPRWFDNGPPVSYLPIPIPDFGNKTRGANCKQCVGMCSGHYLTPEANIQWVNVKKDDCMEPPSATIRNVLGKRESM